MISARTILSVARFEARLLLRAWSFRIFAALALVVLLFMNIGMGSKVGRSPYHFHAAAGFLPLMNFKLLNLFQCVVAAFLAADFLKRDRQHDSTDVIYTKSMTNLEYMSGKVGGVLLVFALLNLLVGVMGFVFHAFLADSPFAWQPYLLYPLLISLPTLVFLIGAAGILMALLRSQALVFLLLLGYCALSLLFLGPTLFNVFDLFAFHQPLTYSQMIGLGNLDQILRLRGAYLLAGIGLIGLATLFLRRLDQSRVLALFVAVVGIGSLVTAALLLVGQLRAGYQQRDYRSELIALSQEAAQAPTAAVKDCRLEITPAAGRLDVTAELLLVNDNPLPLDSILLTLNPGLVLDKVSSPAGDLAFRRLEHLIWVKPERALAVDSSLWLDLTYSGAIDERYCYLDVEMERWEKPYRLWLYSIEKRYALVTPEFVLLTPECGFYPISGVPQAAIFPEPARADFCRFELAANVRAGLTALSQGAVAAESSGPRIKYSFSSTVPLPQVSLAVGKFETHSLEVDSVTYSVHIFPGRNFREEFFDQLGDTLSGLIRELKNDYEMRLGLTYPYSSLMLVEMPIQFFSYERLWTLAQETVQPQMVLIPEMGAICRGTDFRRMERMSTRRQERANQEESAQQIQASHLTSFVRTDLLGMAAAGFGWRGEEEIEARFTIAPNYTTYVRRLFSDSWPVLNYALESYLGSKTGEAAGTGGFRRIGWLSPTEEANLLTKDMSLAEIIGGRVDADLRRNALEVRGKQLLLSWSARLGPELFETRVAQFLAASKFASVPAENMFAALTAGDSVDLEDWTEQWYRGETRPGYLLDDLETYKVRDGNRIKTQVKFAMLNPEPVGGAVKVGFRARQGGRGFRPPGMRGGGELDVSQVLYLPAESRTEVALLLDDPPAMMLVDTYASRNLPSILARNIGEVKTNERALPEVGVTSSALAEDDLVTPGEYIVDNEDQGFAILTQPQPNLLRRILLSLFSSDESDDLPYVGLRFWDPPGSWQLTTEDLFYGRYVHSACYKESGDGSHRVSWTVDLEQSGDYDVYYHVSEPRPPQWWRRGGGGQDFGELQLFVQHEDGVDEVELHLDVASEGWNLLGTYRLAAGRNRVELTDRSSGTLVIADAVKWVVR